jgi:hypothetical protein
MFISRTPQKSIRLAIIWLAFLAFIAGLLAASFGPENPNPKISQFFSQQPTLK